MHKNAEKHEFAFYWPMLSKTYYKSGTIVALTDPLLYHRITRVLRLKKDDHIILFDREHNLFAIINDVFHNQVTIEISDFKKNTIFQPNITFLLPLLKRDALEQAIYSLVELGANEIQLITTQKAQRKWGGQKEMNRLENIMIAAAEQSKNFAFPVLHKPINFEDAIAKSDNSADKIFFDYQGKHAFELIESLYKKKTQHLVLLVGPEGDLSKAEKAIIENTFLLCKLTPTILRAQQAIAVSLGLIRSFFFVK